MTISLTLNDIPDFLKDSELCKNIESDESFDVPIEFFKKELIINTCQDLIDYIKIFDYWMINKIPDEFYKFVLKNKDKINIDLLNDQFQMNDLIKQINIIIETPNDKICSYFSSIGNLELLKYAHENGCSLYDVIYVFSNKLHSYIESSLICTYAASNGHLECLKYALENGCIRNSQICSLAAANGHLDCLKYAHENGCPWDEDICISAANYGHLDCLKYAHENGCTWDEHTCRYAAENGHLNSLKYAHENGCSWNGDTCSIAAENGYLDCLKYAHENGCSWNKKHFSEKERYTSGNNTLLFMKDIQNPDDFTHKIFNYEHIESLNLKICEYAAKNGHLECLKYVHKNGYQLDEWTCYFAAFNGHLECLKYAHKNNCYNIDSILNSDNCICYLAAFNGHLECLKYMIRIINKNYRNDDQYTCNFATINGHLDCLKYAYENGYPFGEGTHMRFENKFTNTCDIAVEYEYLDCLKYALDNGCVLDEEILIKLASHNNFKVIKFLNENYLELLDISIFIIVNNYKWDESLTALIAFNGDLKALKIYIKYGCPWLTEKTTYYAIKKGHYECFKYAIENECLVNKKKCLKYAINDKYLKLLQ